MGVGSGPRSGLDPSLSGHAKAPLRLRRSPTAHKSGSRAWTVAIPVSIRVSWRLPSLPRPRHSSGDHLHSIINRTLCRQTHLPFSPSSSAPLPRISQPTSCLLVVNKLYPIHPPAAMTIVLAHPSQSTLLTRRAGPAAAKRPSPPCWLAWQRDPQYELEDLRTFYHRECTRAETIKRTVATRRKLTRSSTPPYPTYSRRNRPAPAPVDENVAEDEVKDVPMVEAEKPAPTEVAAPTPAPAPLTPSQPERTPGELLLLGMYSSLLESRLQSVERVSKLLSDWQQHKPLST